MRIIGMVGGLGPESTIDYYRRFIHEGHWAVIINSVDVNHLLGLMQRQALDEVTDYLGRAVKQLADAGADIGLVSANTPHIVFDQLQQRSALRLVSIVEATCDHVAALGHRQVGLFGSGYTMKGGFFERVFAARGIAVVRPSDAEQAEIHDKYVNELLKGVFSPETRTALLTIVDALAKRTGVEAVILAGTELPLLLPETSPGGVPLLDTTAVHVRAALRAARLP